MTSIIRHSNVKGKLYKHLAISQDCSGSTKYLAHTHAMMPQELSNLQSVFVVVAALRAHRGAAEHGPESFAP